MLTINKNNPDYNIVSFDTQGQKLTALIADKFKTQLYQLLDTDNKKIILDLKNISFIDSSGFGAIVAVFNHAKNCQLQLSLCNIAPLVMNLIKITKLDQVFDIHSNLEDAMK